MCAVDDLPESENEPDFFVCMQPKCDTNAMPGRTENVIGVSSVSSEHSTRCQDQRDQLATRLPGCPASSELTLSCGRVLDQAPHDGAPRRTAARLQSEQEVD